MIGPYTFRATPPMSSYYPRIADYLKEKNVKSIVNTHAGVLTPKALLDMCDKSEAYLDRIDRELFKALATKEKNTLEAAGRDLTFLRARIEEAYGS